MSDFGAYLRDAVRAGYPFNDTNHARNGGYECRVGAIGVEVASHIPSVIGRRSHTDSGKLAATSGCRIVDFTVHHLEAQEVQKVCDALGIGMLVRRGDKLRVWRPRANLQVFGCSRQKKRAF